MGPCWVGGGGEESCTKVFFFLFGQGDTLIGQSQFSWKTLGNPQNNQNYSFSIPLQVMKVQLGQKLWDKVWCYWEHHGEHHWEPVRTK
jgi:hypothetical protein